MACMYSNHSLQLYATSENCRGRDHENGNDVIMIMKKGGRGGLGCKTHRKQLIVPSD